MLSHSCSNGHNRTHSGERWIRTTEVVRQQIYSLPHLATLESPHKLRANGGTRTPDRLITNQLLYQLSYIGQTTLQNFKDSGIFLLIPCRKMPANIKLKIRNGKIFTTISLVIFLYASLSAF